MESQDLGHEHPLIFFNEEQISNESEADAAVVKCSRCGEAMWGPSFRCGDECRFYVHKQCAEAPEQIHHPFHPDHPLCLLPNPPKDYINGEYFCNFCGEKGEMFVYHCSCNIDLHIKCALFTYNMAEKNLGEIFQDMSYKDPFISNSTGNNGMEQVGSAICFGCWEPLLDSVYCCLDSGIKLHKKCVDLPHEIINHPYHLKHPLILQFLGQSFSCAICVVTHRDGLFYCCSPCKFFIHIACHSLPPIIEDKRHHPHPFTRILILKQVSFTCDACGIEKKDFPYMCSQCNLLVHKECISLPRIVKFTWHEHPIFHTYFLQGEESYKSWECVVCLDKVDTCYGSYSCLHCHFIVHVNCLKKKKRWYYEIEPENCNDDKFSFETCMDSMTVMERNEDGEATRIKHFSHEHYLMLNNNKINIEDDQCCDGCALSISLDHPFYYCCQCDFLLHKKCVEFPMKKNLWFHVCPHPTTLVSGKIFKCYGCRYVCNGFAYRCNHEKWFDICLPCVIPNIVKCQGHEHPLYYHFGYDEGNCNACGKKIAYPFKCKVCNFAVHGHCLKLPQKAPHKCDEHLLTFTYRDDNTYSLTHFCDICEKDRDPSLWFYHCAICDTSAHPQCVLGRYPFMKPGKIYKDFDQLHPHPLIFVKKIHHYPECFKCGDPCQDLALECVNSECRYIVHWDCIAPSNLKES